MWRDLAFLPAAVAVVRSCLLPLPSDSLSDGPSIRQYRRNLSLACCHYCGLQASRHLPSSFRAASQCLPVRSGSHSLILQHGQRPPASEVSCYLPALILVCILCCTCNAGRQSGPKQLGLWAPWILMLAHLQHCQLAQPVLQLTSCSCQLASCHGQLITLWV